MVSLNKLNTLLVLLFIPLFSLSQDKVKFIAGGVTCSMCSNAIHKALHSDKDVLKIDPNLETQEWNVEYKQGTYTLDKLKKSVESAGFSLNKVYFNGELVLDNSKKKRASKSQPNLE